MWKIRKSFGISVFFCQQPPWIIFDGMIYFVEKINLSTKPFPLFPKIRWIFLEEKGDSGVFFGLSFPPITINLDLEPGSQPGFIPSLA